MIFMLGGTLRDNDRNDRKIKHLKKPILPDPPDDIINPVIFNEGKTYTEFFLNIFWMIF